MTDVLMKDLASKLMEDVTKNLLQTVNLYCEGGGPDPRGPAQLQLGLQAAVTCLLGVATVLDNTKPSADTFLFCSLLGNAFYNSIMNKKGEPFLEIFRQANEDFKKLRDYGYSLGVAKNLKSYDIDSILERAVLHKARKTNVH